MSDAEKRQKADEIIAELADELTHIIMDTDGTQHAAPRYLLPWLEEDAEMSVKALKLDPEDEKIYLHKINNLMGSYSDNPPVDIF